jgi:hypothetical protein
MKLSSLQIIASTALADDSACGSLPGRASGGSDMPKRTSVTPREAPSKIRLTEAASSFTTCKVMVLGLKRAKQVAFLPLSGACRCSARARSGQPSYVHQEYP